MRLPSVDQLVAGASASLRRFPFVIGAAALSAAIAHSVTDGPMEAVASVLGASDSEDLLYSSTLAIPLFFALRLAQERGLYSKGIASALRIVGLLLLLSIAWRWVDWSEQVQVLRYMQFSVAAHLLAAFLPFARRGELNGFWQYNRVLFLRVLETGIYAGVLFAGLALALAAIEQLFGVDLYGEAYFDLFLVIAFVFTAWYFVGGVPRDVGELEEADDYPRVLKLFAQYVLIPLVTIYLAILLAYFVKVLVSSEWPSGWIGWLVSGVSVVGILSILLTYPIRDREEGRWVAQYSGWFWIAMIPAIAMLLIAIGKRISQYGVTEPRYFLVVLTLWLAVMSVLYGIRRSANIKILPLSLCALAIATVFGPWGAYDVSRNSQTNRFRSLLDSNGLVNEGRAVAAEAADEVSLDDQRELSGSLTYLLANHGSAGLVDLLGADLAVTDSAGGTDPVRRWEARDRAGSILRTLNLEYVEGRRGDSQFFNYRTEPRESLPLAGYDYSFRTNGNEVTVPWLDGDSLRIVLDSAEVELDVSRTSSGAVILSVPLSGLIDRAAADDAEGPFDSTHTIPADLLSETVTGGGLEARMVVESIHGEHAEEGPRVTGISATWLVRVGDSAAVVDTVRVPASP